MPPSKESSAADVQFYNRCGERYSQDLNCPDMRYNSPCDTETLVDLRIAAKWQKREIGNVQNVAKMNGNSRFAKTKQELVRPKGMLSGIQAKSRSGSVSAATPSGQIEGLI